MQRTANFTQNLNNEKGMARKKKIHLVLFIALHFPYVSDKEHPIQEGGKKEAKYKGMSRIWQCLLGKSGIK